MNKGGCVAIPQFDHLSLVAADAERSLDGLVHSLQRGTAGMSQGALHSRDLSSALSTMGLDAAAGLVDDVGRQMTLGQPSVLDVAQDLIPLIAQAVKDIQLGHVPESDAQVETWGPWSSKLQVLVSRDAVPLNNFEAVVPKASSAPLPAPDPEPVASAAIWTAPASDDVPSASVVTEADPGFRALRMHGLNLIQNARIVNQRDDERTVRQMDALLSELQDWSLRVGQQPLSRLFSQASSAVADVWLDAVVLDRLEPLRALSLRATQIQAQSRSLIIYVEWLGLSLSDEEYQQIGRCLRVVCGQIKRIDQGYRLVFPSSLTRMRVIPFILKGQRYAVGGAQFLQFQADTNEAGAAGSLILRSGLDSKSLQVDRVLPAENMNLFELPQGIDRPEWLSGVALDGAGETYFCVTPQ
jgi:hypothetical protein